MSKRKPPSRIRYEQRNPTISCRVPAEFKEELNAHLQMTGQSLSGWIQDAFEGREDTVKEAERAYWRGWEKGADQAISNVSIALRIGVSGEEEQLVQAVLDASERSFEAEDQAEADVHIDSWNAARERLATWLLQKAREEGRRG